MLRWHLRYLERRIRAPEEPVKSRLLDRPRTGAPDRITPEQYVDLLVLATTEPEALGLPLTHWSSRDLADQAVARGIVATLHDSTMSRFLSA